MANQQGIMEIQVKPSPELQALFKNLNPKQKGILGDKLGAMFQKLGGNSTQSLGKLAMIGAGVFAVVHAVQKIWGMIVDSSPMLQSMLKLFQVGIMFMLRPIGDFIGFLLRPLMIYLVRNVFIPWYRQMAPIMRKIGDEWGKIIVDFIKDPWGTLIDLLTTKLPSVLAGLFPAITVFDDIKNGILGFALDLGQISVAAGEKVKAFLDSIGTSLMSIFENAKKGITDAWNKIFTFFLDLHRVYIKQPLEYIWNTITNFFTNLYGTVIKPIETTWGIISKFFTDLFNNQIKAPLQFVWSTIVNFFTNLYTTIIKPIADVFNSIGKVFDDIYKFLKGLPIVGAMLGGDDKKNKGSTDIVGDIGKSLAKGVQEIFAPTNSKTNTLNMNIGGVMDAMSIDRLKNDIFNWIQQANSKRGTG